MIFVCLIQSSMLIQLTREIVRAVQLFERGFVVTCVRVIPMTAATSLITWDVKAELFSEMGFLGELACLVMVLFIIFAFVFMSWLDVGNQKNSWKTRPWLPLYFRRHQHQVNLHGVFWRSNVLPRVLHGRAGESAINPWFFNALVTWHNPLLDQKSQIWVIIFCSVSSYCLGNSRMFPKVYVEAAEYFTD